MDTINKFNVGDAVYHVGRDLRGKVLENTSNKYHQTYKVEFINEYGYKEIYDYCSDSLMVKIYIRNESVNIIEN